MWSNNPSRNKLLLCTAGGKQPHTKYWAGPLQKWIDNFQKCKRMKNSEDGICIKKNFAGYCSQYTMTAGVRMNGVTCKNMGNMDLANKYANQIGVAENNIRASCQDLKNRRRRRRLLKRSADATSAQIVYTIVALEEDDVGKKI